MEYNQKSREINFVNPSIDTSTGTIKLRAVFPNPNNRLRPGQFMRLTVEGLERANALIVPQTAVMQSSKGSYVYRLNDKNEVEIANIKTGQTVNKEYWTVNEGLEQGDRVVVNNLLKVRPGMVVNPMVIDNPTDNNK